MLYPFTVAPYCAAAPVILAVQLLLAAAIALYWNFLR